MTGKELKPYLFQPGNPGGPGTGKRQAANRTAILAAITPQIAVQMILTQVEIASNPAAKAADRSRAAEIVLAYGAGKPTERHQLEVTTDPQPLPINLDATDLADLERIRSKLVTQRDNEAVPDAEIVVIEPATISPNDRTTQPT